jgi:hypothetical protein
MKDVNLTALSPSAIAPTTAAPDSHFAQSSSPANCCPVGFGGPHAHWVPRPDDSFRTQLASILRTSIATLTTTPELRASLSCRDNRRKTCCAGPRVRMRRFGPSRSGHTSPAGSASAR